MNIREQGFLLLTSFLGDPERRPLTVAQFRKLTNLAAALTKPEGQRELTEADLISIGCDPSLARKAVRLLAQEELLAYYLRSGAMADCVPITRISEGYPRRLRKVLGPDAPGTLWYKGDKAILNTTTVSVVGSRELKPDNAAFAEEIGRQAALQGYTLVSGNARGADRIAQDACLACGGKVISIVADELNCHKNYENILYISEEGFNLPFTSLRALQRNRIIHSFSEKTFVVQCTLGKGGTWNGTKDNLRYNRSIVLCCDDGSDAAQELFCMGAIPVSINDLEDIASLKALSTSFF